MEISRERINDMPQTREGFNQSQPDALVLVVVAQYEKGRPRDGPFLPGFCEISVRGFRPYVRLFASANDLPVSRIHRHLAFHRHDEPC